MKSLAIILKFQLNGSKIITDANLKKEWKHYTSILFLSLWQISSFESMVDKELIDSLNFTRYENE